MANYNSTYTGAQIDSAVGKALNPDTAPDSGSTELITSGAVATALAAKAPLASPAFTGNPTATTQGNSNNSTRLATTAFVHNLTDGKVLPAFQSFNVSSNTVLTLGPPAAYRGLILILGPNYYMFIFRTTTDGAAVPLVFFDNESTHPSVARESGNLVIRNESSNLVYVYAIQLSGGNSLTEISREPIT